MPFLNKFKTAIVMCGDTPLLTYESLYNLAASHEELKGQVTLLTAKLANPKGYGRIVRARSARFSASSRSRSASSEGARHQRDQLGRLLLRGRGLLTGLKEIGAKGPKKEHFLTDVLEVIRGKGGRIHAYASANAEEVQGINNRAQLPSPSACSTSACSSA